MLTGAAAPLRRAQVYEPFFADFGPLNMACAFRFCQRALAALEARRGRAGARATPAAVRR